MNAVCKTLCFAEGPRWRGGDLYFSDFYQYSVFRWNPGGDVASVAAIPEQPSGLGWLPDGRLLIVSMLDRKVLRQELDGTLVTHADLSNLAPWHCNDMVVDAKGRAYVGNFGFDSHGGEPEKPTQLIRVDSDGSARAVADGLLFPNGTVITPDGGTLVIAETRGHRLTAFDVAADGYLSNQRLWADLGSHYPDGIALDAENCIWVADPRNHCVIRVAEGGAIKQRIDLDRGAYACALGGDDRRTLFICAATGSGEHAKARRDGQILAVEVAVPGAGIP